jgi:signal transduction histidine kinase
MLKNKLLLAFLFLFTGVFFLKSQFLTLKIDKKNFVFDVFCNAQATLLKQSNLQSVLYNKNTYKLVFKSNIQYLAAYSWLPITNNNAKLIYTAVFPLQNSLLLGFLTLSIHVLSFSFLLLYSWWFFAPICLLLIGVIIFLINKNKKLKIQSDKIIHEQQQFIRNERQRISGEIHDDIGSGLFAIKLHADMASKKRADVTEIKEISTMVNEMSDKINEIIWSTNTESDKLENLLYYIEHQTIKLFEYSEITYDPVFPIDVPEVIITSQSRRNTYLLIKEIVHNSIKHAKATHVSLHATVSNGLLIFSIKDDGIGFDPKTVRQNAMGLKNIKARIEKLKGTLVIENYKGTLVMVKIPLDVGLMAKFNKQT